MKKTAKKIIAITVLFSLCIIPASAVGAEGVDSCIEIKGENGLYVYIGDSMTYDFVAGHNGYLHSGNYSTDIYAWQAAREFGYTTGSFGKFPGGRTTDVYASLSESYNGDDYGQTELNDAEDDDNYLSGPKVELFRNAIRDAKVVSVQIGYSELTTFLLANIMNYLDEGKTAYNCDLSQIFSQEELAKLMPFVSKTLKLVDNVIPDGTKTAFSKFLTGLSDTEKKALVTLIGQEAFDSLSGATGTVGAIKDALVYTMASSIVHFDAMIGEIYKLNPDVELYVMGLVNPITQLRLGFELNGKDYAISLGELAGGFYRIMNSYYRIFSPYSDRYYFVENVHHAETFSEAMRNDEELTRRILYASYNETNFSTVYDEDGNPVYFPRNGYIDEESYARNKEAYRKAVEQAPGVMQALENTIMIDIGKVIAGLVDGESLETSTKSFEKVAVYDENGKTTASYLEQFGAHIAAFQILKGIYVHPTNNGHNAEAKLLIAAMKDPKVDPYAIAYHKLAAPMEKTVEALDKCATIDDLIEWSEDVKEIWSDSGEDVEEPF